MATVIPNITPRTRPQNPSAGELQKSYISLDSDLNVLAFGGLLFASFSECTPTVQELASTWQDSSDLAINIENVCERVLQTERPASYSRMRCVSHEGGAYDISIVPRFPVDGFRLSGISIIFTPTAQEQTSSQGRYRSKHFSSPEQNHQLNDDLPALAVALETSNVTSWQFYPQDAQRLEFFGAWEDQTGDSFASEMGCLRDFIAFVHPDDRSVLESLAENCKSADFESFELECRLQNQDGIYEYILSRGRVIERDEQGLPIRVIGTFTDVNELKLSESRLDMALEIGRQGFWELRHDGSIKLSASWHGLFGYEVGIIERLSPDFSELIHPQDYIKTSTSFEKLLNNPGHVHQIEYRIRHKQGHYLWVADQGATIERDVAGNAQKIIGSMVDITPHRNALLEAKNSREFLQLILDEIPNQIFWKDHEHRILGCNRSYSKFHGVDDPAQLIGKSTSDLYGPDEALRYEADDNNVIRLGTSIVKEEILSPNGRGLWVESTKLPLSLEPGEDSEKNGLLVHFREITEERTRREQLESLADIMSGDLGERRLDRLVAGTANLSQTDVVFIGRYNKHDKTISVIASHSPDNLLDGVTYEIENTPCESVILERASTFNDHVQQVFPDDKLLQDLDISSYAGKRLVDNHGETVGIFSLMNRAPMPNFDQAASLIDIVSSTATYELIRETRENAIITSEKRYRNIYDSVPVMICTTDEHHNILDINSTWIETTGYIHDDIVGKSVNCLFNTEDRRAIQTNIAKAWQGDECHRDGYLRMIASDGAEVIVSHSAVHSVSSGGGNLTINVFEDMREQYKSAQQLRLAAIAFETHEALLIRDGQRRVLRANEAFTNITGYPLAEITGTTFEYFIADGNEDTSAITISEGKWQGNGTCKRANGETFSAHQTITAVKDDKGEITHYVENFNDITDYVEALAESERLAYFDSLTELPNRRQLTDRLRESLSAATRHKHFGAVMFIDLDHFKNINDAVGHSVGDLVLQQVAQRLTQILRQEDTVSRLGGDEFVVLISNVSTDRTRAAERASMIAEKIQQELRKPYEVDDHEFHITPTIGITFFPEQQETVDDVLKQADAAMYRAKADGRDQSRFYNESMQDGARERLLLEKDLRKAVANDELYLVFQPQVLGTGQVFGAEALLRWKHPTRGLVSPADFIPIAEETGLILEIGKWVLNEAFAVLSDWENGPLRHMIEHLSVNVSSRQFGSQDFVEDVAKRFKEHGTDPRKVVLEVTESTVIDKIQATVSKMEELRQLGFRFSVDDFGTGYSSLAYLSRLPLDQLKIDRTFVINLDDPANAVIVETILAMGKHLNLQTVAEGVETEGQLSFLNARNCNAYQGYYFSRPLDRAEFERFLLAR